MDLGLSSKVALLSGASRGIGFACAKVLAREGARVALFARDRSGLDAAASEISRDCGQEPLVGQADLGDANSVQRFVDAALERFGRLDIVVANSVGPKPGTFDKFAVDDWANAFDGSVLSIVRLMKATLPALTRNGGAVVAVQSTSVRQPIPGLALSNGTRPAAAGLMKTLAAEYGPAGIRFNVVCPGRIVTERFLAVESSYGQPLDERLAAMAGEVPLRRLGEPHEVADAVAFLASQRAAYISGSVVMVDGGNVRGL